MTELNVADLETALIALGKLLQDRGLELPDCCNWRRRVTTNRINDPNHKRFRFSRAC